MITSGPNTAGTGADDNSVGGSAWQNPTRVTASDNSYATVGLAGISNPTSHYLKATNFSFSIPSNAIIRGILVEWEMKEGTAGGTDNSVKIVKGGTITGTDLAQGTIGTTESFHSYGGSSQLWGTTWTASDINSSTFGAVYSANWAGAKETSDIVSVDSCRITIYYDLPSSNFFFFFPGK